jgi:hypothetical protein
MSLCVFLAGRGKQYSRAVAIGRGPHHDDLAGPNEAARRALRLSPRDPFSAVYTGIAAYAHFIGRAAQAPLRRTPLNSINPSAGSEKNCKPS